MGGILSVAQQSFPPHPTWAVDDIPDLTGKVAIVTGALTRRLGVLYAKRNLVAGSNVGVGKETVKVCMFGNYPRWCRALQRGVKPCTGASET